MNRKQWRQMQRAVMRDLGRAMGAPGSATRDALAGVERDAVMSGPPPVTLHFHAESEQPLRHTQLGMRPVNVNTIDEMDLALSNQMAELNRLRKALADKCAQTLDAVEYAEAHNAWKGVNVNTSLEDAKAMRQRWRWARRAYRGEQE